MAQSSKVKAAPNATFKGVGVTDGDLFTKADSLAIVALGFKFQKTL
jgi:hypothetical protein